MKVMLTGGGTGGHIYPALAIAEKLKKDNKGTEIVYVGSKDGMEKDIVPKLGLTYLGIDAAPLNKKFSKKTIKAIVSLFKGLHQANKAINRYKPDVIVGTGGYVAGAVVFIGALRGIPTVIHEQNAYPGLTNRLLSRFVDVILLTFDDAKQHFKYPEKLVYTGLPVMANYFVTSREQSRQKLGISRNEMMVLTVGGSNGALKLNQIMLDAYVQMNKLEQIRFIHVSGNRYFDKLQSEVKSGVFDLGDNFKLMSYLKDMPTYLSAADLVISRAGASTINEIIASKTPSVIIPSPNVSNNHQLHNAQIMDKHGMGVIVKEEDLTVDLITHIITDFYKDRSKLDIMRSNCEKINLTKTLDVIASVVYRLVDGQ